MRNLITSITIILMCLCPMPAQALMRGDLNNDGNIDVADVNAVIDLVLGVTKNASQAADMNRDGQVDVADVSAIIDRLLSFAPMTCEVNGVKFQLNEVESGKFYMGEYPDRGGWDNEQPVHRVYLSAYYIGQTPVTQEQWIAVMGTNPSYFKGAQRPVETVDYNDCLEFLSRLDSLTGLAFRLPTEAEWEFAARGGNLSDSTSYSGSNDVYAVAWCADNSGSGTHPVAQKEPNELGLFDMSGNVWEWCHDWYYYYTNGKVTDPQGRSTGTYRVQRGGGWNGSPVFCRCTSRYMAQPAEPEP